MFVCIGMSKENRASLLTPQKSDHYMVYIDGNDCPTRLL
jgi:hypothetical protein